MKTIFTLVTMFILVGTAHSTERKVLVEMFTNSHCSICPGAHAALNLYVSTSPNANRVRYIFYHTLFPYSDDALAQANTTEPAARNSYYNGPTSTPNTFFDGVNQGRTYSSFALNLDAQMMLESPIDIQLSGRKNGNTITVNASVSKTGIISESDLVIHIIAVENVSYIGRNGVSPQSFVMRKMLTGTNGQIFQFDQTNAVQISKSDSLKNITDINKVGVIVFVQSTSTKKIYQSEYISYSTLTNINSEKNVTPIQFELNQNYPNPFNPETTIQYTVGTSEKTFQSTGHGFSSEPTQISLKVYDVLGREVAVLVNSSQEAGTHTVQFNAKNLLSGIYFYRLHAGNFVETKKMILQK